ncbi:MAG: tRNA (guanosine(46)-N7)-methyltransferase TrmB [Bacteroidetes bacterium]|nr:tRNA (guanosine(46)-N7)-methyltransferase TrmB [Bacteroidota bacterium]
MGKSKLARFAENNSFKNMIQLPEPMAGKWSDFFGNKNPLVLELACGHGDYTVQLAKLYPEKNFIGIDRKGARMWRGAKTAIAENLNNVAFLRIFIDHCDLHFAQNEVSEIWITFADPHPTKDRKKLTHPLFLNRYIKFLENGAKINLKTDDDHLYHFTLDIIRQNKFIIHKNIENLYFSDEITPELQIKTYYEKMWLEKNKTIKFLQFSM